MYGCGEGISIPQTRLDTKGLVNGIVLTYFAKNSKGIRYNQIINGAKFSGHSDRTIKRSIAKLEEEGVIKRVVYTSTKPVNVTYEPNLEYAHEIAEIMKKDLFLKRFYTVSEWFNNLEADREKKVELLTHILRNMFFLTSKWPALAIQWALKEENKHKYINDFMIRWNGDILFRIIALIELCWEHKDIADEALNKALEWMDKDLKCLGEEAIKGKKDVIDFSKIYP